MRFLPTRIHGVIDYLWGLALIATPFVLNFADGGAAQWTAVVAGAGALVYAALTDFELGIWRVLPMPAHLVVDGLGGAALAASPFLFGFADRVLWPHVLFGLFAVVASLITETRARG